MPRYIRFDNFLPSTDRDSIHQYAIDSRPRFTPSTVSTGDTTYRRSLVLHSVPPDIKALVVEPLRQKLPEVCDRLNVRPYPDGQIECQITRSGVGDYFRYHTDNASPGTKVRVLTYVYYLVSEGLQGGEFLLHRDSSNVEEVIPPSDNMLLVFPSSVGHAVGVVKALGGDDWGDGRFTVNGWVRAKPA